MKKGRFTPEQIIGVPKQHEAGRKVQELAQELGVSESGATRYTGGKRDHIRDVNDVSRRLLWDLELARKPGYQGPDQENRRSQSLIQSPTSAFADNFIPAISPPRSTSASWPPRTSASILPAWTEQLICPSIIVTNREATLER